MGLTEVGPGDAFFFQPGEAHQLTNAGDEDFVYYVIADNPRGGGATGDSCYYPDSGKWAVTKEAAEELIVKGMRLITSMAKNDFYRRGRGEHEEGF